MKITIHLILILFFAPSLFGQNEYVETSPKIRKNQIGLQVEYFKGYLKDGHLSKLNYTGSGLGVQLEYLRKPSLTSNQFSIKFNGSSGTLETIASEFFDLNALLFQVDMTYLFNLKKQRKGLQLYLGGAYQYDAFVFINDELNVPGVSFLGGHNFNVVGQLGWQMNDNHLFQSRLSIPFISSTIRPVYNVFDEYYLERSVFKVLTVGEITTWNKFQTLDLELDYFASLSSRWNLKLSYELRLRRMTKIQTIVFGYHQTRIGFNFKF